MLGTGRGSVKSCCYSNCFHPRFLGSITYTWKQNFFFFSHSFHKLEWARGAAFMVLCLLCFSINTHLLGTHLCNQHLFEAVKNQKENRVPKEQKQMSQNKFTADPWSTSWALGKGNISWRCIKGPLWPYSFLHSLNEQAPSLLHPEADEGIQMNVLFTQFWHLVMHKMHIYSARTLCQALIRYSVSSQRALDVVRGVGKYPVGWTSAEMCAECQGGLGVTKEAFKGDSTKTESLGQIGIEGWKGEVGIPVKKWRMRVKAWVVIGCSESHRKSASWKVKNMWKAEQALVNYSGNKNFAMELLIQSKNCTKFFIYGVLMNFQKSPVRCSYFHLHFTETSSKKVK